MLSMVGAAPALARAQGRTSIRDMRTDDLANPIGIDNAKPVFSWKMDSDVIGQRQTAYRIIVKEQNKTVWDSGKIADDTSVGVVYGGSALSSCTKYDWAVTVWDKDGAAIDSETASFETAFLDKNGFADAKWISYADNQSDMTRYTIDLDFIIDDTAAGFCFGMEGSSTFIMWQVQVS